jgi:tellurite resistance protein TerC
MYLLQNIFTAPASNLTIVFAVVLLIIVLLDLSLFQKRNHTPTFKNTLLQTGFWFVMAALFGAFLWVTKGHETGAQFFSGYLMEWSLSADNIFVFILILKYFQMPQSSHQRILFWGIIGAIIFRGIFIGLGSALVGQFHWILYIFGVILIYTGAKIFFEKEDDGDDNYSPEKNVIYRWLKKYLPFSDDVKATSFSIVEYDKKFYTPLFLVIWIIATTDVVFAIDSIPAVFSITQNKLIIYSSNVFAVMGLRSMFFLLSNIIKRFAYLQQGISLILIFIGVKMLLEIFNIHIPTYLSLLIIVVGLGGSVLFSIMQNRKEKVK